MFFCYATGPTNLYVCDELGDSMDKHLYKTYIALRFVKLSLTTFQLSSRIILSKKSPTPSRLLQFAKFSLQDDLTFWTKNTPFKVKPQQQKNSAFLFKGSSWDFLPYQKKTRDIKNSTRSVETSSTRWFKVTFSPLFGGSLNHLQGSLNHPKKGHKELPHKVVSPISSKGPLEGGPPQNQSIELWGKTRPTWPKW